MRQLVHIVAAFLAIGSTAAFAKSATVTPGGATGDPLPPGITCTVTAGSVQITWDDTPPPVRNIEIEVRAGTTATIGCTGADIELKGDGSTVTINGGGNTVHTTGDGNTTTVNGNGNTHENRSGADNNTTTMNGNNNNHSDTAGTGGGTESKPEGNNTTMNGNDNTTRNRGDDHDDARGNSTTMNGSRNRAR